MRSIALTSTLQQFFSYCAPPSENELRHVDRAWWRSQRLCLHHLRSSAGFADASYKHADAYVYHLDL
jgi:hypothetical protein